MKRKLIVVAMMLVVAGVLGRTEVVAQGPTPGRAPRAGVTSGFTYQGLLKSNGTPVNGSCDMSFRLYDAESNGLPVGDTLTPVVTVTDGLFTTTLDFGLDAFSASPRWLDVQVRCPAGSGAFTPFSARQAVTPAPYAQYALTAGSLAGGLPSGSANYIQNTTSSQSGANFNISGSGTLGGNLNLPNTSSSSVGILNLGGSRFLHNYGTRNTFLGSSAGNWTLTGSNNVAVGYQALTASTSGSFNAAFGANALLASTSGSSNTAIGNAALYSNTGGSFNTGVGASALLNNIGATSNTGSYNTGVGSSALQANTSGNGNTAVGSSALSHNNINGYNVAVGNNALTNNTGYNNTAVGASALNQITTGYSNIALGYSAGTNYTSAENNNIAIADPGVTGENNTMRIGKDGTQTKTYIAGIYGVNVGASSTVYINSNGQLGTVNSSRRFKENIRDMAETSGLLYQLRPVTFNYKPEYGGSSGEKQAGLIAEEVAAVAPWMVLMDKEGQPLTVRYEQLAPMLVNEIQKQHGTIQDQAAEITQLQAQVTTLREENATTTRRLSALENALENSGVMLASTSRGSPTGGWDPVSAPAWMLVGMVGWLVVQRVRRGGK